MPMFGSSILASRSLWAPSPSGLATCFTPISTASASCLSRSLRSWQRPVRRWNAASGRCWKSVDRRSFRSIATSIFEPGFSPKRTNEVKRSAATVPEGGRSNRALGAGMNDHHGLVAPIPPHDLVGTDLVEPFPRGGPLPFAVLEDGRSQPACGQRVERVGVEMDADESEKMTRLPVTGPEDLIVPPRVLPAGTLHGIDAVQRGHESRFQPFVLTVKRLTSLVHVQIFEDHAKGASQQEKCRAQADGQNTSPDQPTHVQAPGHAPESVIRRLILESPPRSTQVTVSTDLSGAGQRT